MLGQPVFIGGAPPVDPPPPVTPEVVSTPSATLVVDSTSCSVEYEMAVSWSTINPNNIAYKCRIVNHGDPSTVYADDVGMSGTEQFGLNIYGGGSSSWTFQARVQVVRRSDNVVVDSMATNSINRSNIGPPC